MYFTGVSSCRSAAFLARAVAAVSVSQAIDTSESVAPA